MQLTMIVGKGKRITLEIIEKLKLTLDKEDLNEEQVSVLKKIITDTEEYVTYNEWGVGIEIASDNLYEYSIPISKSIQEKFEEVCKHGNLKDSYYKSLEELVK